MSFEWDDKKSTLNIIKHGLSFDQAQEAFFDKKRIILKDVKHSQNETRYFCLGMTSSGLVSTVRFTLREGNIRIIGAGY